jgi:hypothetical protein
MTPRERLGKRLFVILATMIVLNKLGAVLSGALHGEGGVEWQQLVLAPSFETLVVVAAGLLRHWSVALGVAVAVPFLWRGNDLLRRLVGGRLRAFRRGHLAYLLYLRPECRGRRPF